MKFFECYSCRRVLMFKSDRNTGKRKCIKNRKQILTIPEIREKKLRKNGKEKSGKMKSQTGQYLERCAFAGLQQYPSTSVLSSSFFVFDLDSWWQISRMWIMWSDEFKSEIIRHIYIWRKTHRTGVIISCGIPVVQWW
jgi:hypothetical protein